MERLCEMHNPPLSIFRMNTYEKTGEGPHPSAAILHRRVSTRRYGDALVFWKKLATLMTSAAERVGRWAHRGLVRSGLHALPSALEDFRSLFVK